MVINNASMNDAGMHAHGCMPRSMTIRLDNGITVDYDKKYIISALADRARKDKAIEMADSIENRLVLSKDSEGHDGNCICISESEINDQVQYELHGRGVSKKSEERPSYTNKNTKLDFFTRHLPLVERSDGTTELFMPARIMKSLIGETSIPEGIASKATEEIVIRLINSKQKTVTASFIREQVCDVLYGINPAFRFGYTRLGMPYHDFNMLCGSFLKRFSNVTDVDERAVEELISEIDNAKLVQILLRMFRDYISTRNNMKKPE